MQEMIELYPDNIEKLTLFSKMLKKDINTIFNEALTLYFEHEEKKLAEKNSDHESAMTNLDFDEFWEGVEI